ncbi:MAG: hypothetical protein GY805_30740 [Chloroflexi bacterium]|nr:hypothetical protein [Chloroflexota bacterium]
MKSTNRFISLFLGIIVFLLLIEALSGTAVTHTNAATGANNPLMVEYPIPTAGDINGEPRNIIVQEPGHSWFTLPAANQIGELVVTSTVNYQFHLYDIPTTNSEPHGLVYDGDNIWFTAKAANQIGRLDLASSIITTHTIPTANSMPTDIAQALDGRIWFVNNASNNLAVFDPTSPDQITEYPIICNSGDPANLENIAISHADSVWITAPGCNRVFEFQPSSTSIVDDIPVGTIWGDVWTPGNITIGHNNAPWITVPDEDLFGHYRPGTLTYWRWRDTISEQAQLTDIAFSTSNNIDHVWVTEADGNRVGLLLTTLQEGDISFREFSLPSANSYPHSIAIDNANHAWITASGANKIIEWSPPYFFTVNLPLIIK